MDVSIVVPTTTKNSADILERCLKSIQNLEYEDELEAVIVDGNSSDGTVDIAKIAEGEFDWSKIGKVFKGL